MSEAVLALADGTVFRGRAFGTRGSRETMLPLLATFYQHPLLVQALASVVAHDRRAVGDFDRWGALRTDFDPFPLLHTQRKTHVLAHAFRGPELAHNRVLLSSGLADCRPFRRPLP